MAEKDILREIIAGRRAIRKFTKDPVDTALIEELLVYASMGPSKGNAHPVDFIHVTGEGREKLAEMRRFGSAYLKDAPGIVVVLGDKNVDPTWMEEATIAAAYLGLLLVSEGLSSSWINVRSEIASDGRDAEEFVREALNIPENWGVLALIPYGHPGEKVKSKEPFELEDKLHREKF
ncbi:MAG: nitroreductase family protein [Tissierellia bacterium]|nr:nitroreductase family protein [Tissierellia bacterium]